MSSAHSYAKASFAQRQPYRLENYSGPDEQNKDSSDADSLDSVEDENGDSPQDANVFRGVNKPKSSDVFIAVMGATGSGKSSFISLCCGKAVKLGHDLNPGTSTIEVYAYEISPDQTVYLIDTPGFNDMERSDTEVLREIADWLNKSYETDILLRGILYFHRITDTRMQGSARKNILLFSKLCGDEALKNVLLVTSMWDKLPKSQISDAKGKEKQLVETHEYWGFMVSKGSTVLRHRNTADSARAIVNRLVNGKGCAIKLDVQEQMVDKKQTLNETAAGRELNAAVAKERRKWEREMQDTQEQMREFMRARDEEAKQVLCEMKKEDAQRPTHKDRRAQEKEWQRELREMRETQDQMREAMRAQEKESQQALREMREEYNQRLARLERDKEHMQVDIELLRGQLS
ncbi:FAD binding domain-containing protein [Colletotrichum higginsianum]|nr:FAD binding domain-containing protein [Colletotrichum higginsianum]